MPSFKSLLFGVCAILPMVQAHMQMLYPLPLNSPLDPSNTNPDYDYKSPLNADGSNYPCKGYQNSAAYSRTYTTQATWIAGQTYNMTISPDGANHNGGSCQLSLSYDNGATFKVLESIIGGCPVTLSYNFTIPSFAPASGSALFAWSWMNVEGNREMYMDCARVQIQSPSSSRHRRALYARQPTSNAMSMQDLPDLFKCNINNGCTSIEFQDVHFPQPGAFVIYGQDLVSTTSGAGYFLSSVNSSSTGSFVSATGTVTTTTSTTSQSSANSMTTTTTPISVTSSQSPSQSPMSTSGLSTSPTSVPLGGSCTPGIFACNSPTTFSQCGAGGTYVFMGSVAAGMQCSNGAFIRQNSGTCSTNGQIVCNGQYAFYICDQGGLVNMGPVAPGTTCVNGVIQ